MADLFQRLLLATEHTAFDVGAESLALAMAQRCQVPLDCVFPLVSNPEFEVLAPQLAAGVAQKVLDLSDTPVLALHNDPVQSPSQTGPP